MNYHNLKNINYHGKSLIIIVSIILYIALILSITLYGYDSTAYFGKYVDGKLYVNILIDNSDVVKKGNVLKIYNELTNYSIINISDLYENNMQNFQIYEIKIDKKYRNNEVVKITFYANKERIIKKVINFIFGKEK